MSRSIEQTLAGWGNYRPDRAHVFRPERRAELRALATLGPGAEDALLGRGDLIARGLGRSYGDCAVNAGGSVALQARMDCLVDFDPATGVVEAEAGVSIGTLIDVLLPRGFFPPVTPGTKHVTLGGAVAADVHGKNHHADGTISAFVDSLKLLTAAGEVLNCSRDENADVFWATVGGMGLTGFILSVRLRMLKVPSAYVSVRYTKAPSLDKAIERFEDPASRAAPYSVAWIDCVAGGAALGRSVIMEGEFLPADRLRDAGLSRRAAAHPFDPRTKRAKNVPFNFPGFALGKWSVKRFNKYFYWKHAEGVRPSGVDAFFYPLDGIHHWNRIYGKRGFVQYQALLPHAAARKGLVELLERISGSGMASFLAVLKRTGEQGPGMLSFPFPGYTLALDLPNTGSRLETLATELDTILLKHGGRLYLAKDSLMSAETFKAMYPRLDEFRAVKARVDPTNRFSSTQARRVGIVT